MNTDDALATVGDPDLLQEMKEAVADAHLEFIRRWVSGEGTRGRVVLGGRPSSRLASGFILPRLNVDNDDEANDIRIPSHGLDIAVRPDAEGVIELEISLAVYLRVLPEVVELFGNDGLHLPPADYSVAAKRAMRDERRRLRRERLRPEMTRAERQAVIDAIAREIEAAYGVTVPEAAPAPGLGADEEEEGVEPVHAPLSGRRRIPSCHSRDYEVPRAYIRIEVPPVRAVLPLPPGPGWVDEAASARVRLLTAIYEACTTWLSTDEGAHRAWRSAPRPVSEDFWTPDAWSEYLARARAVRPARDELVPAFDFGFRFDALPLRSLPGAHSIRIAIENEREGDYDREYGLFGVSIVIALPANALLPASLERVRRSYHLEGFLEVPAIGLNCGIERVNTRPEIASFRTTWMPRYVLPRTAQNDVLGVETRFAKLAEPGFDPAALAALPETMRTWIEGLRGRSDPGADPAQSDHLRRDIAAWEREASRVQLGIDLLLRSRAAASETPAAAAWAAWLALQETFARMYGPATGNREPGWRLFQLAFVLSHIPTLASRVPGFDGTEFFQPEFDEEAATLLYMSTGGGKTEAFFGTVVYAAFLDRLRGKKRGVTAMMHYPLRLLTVQQAQRLARTLAAAERVRVERGMDGAPFEIGFWVGGGNTPNNVEKVRTDANGRPTAREVIEALAPIPVHGTPRASDEAVLMDADGAPPENRLYQAAQAAWNKLPTCPFCNTGGTGLRLFPEQHHRLGIICHTAECDWNEQHGGPGQVPLPFLLTDADIYRRAPTVLLGTIDKLALIGHDIGRIGEIGGMFGLARRISGGPNGMLAMGAPIDGDPPSTFVAPAYEGGEEIFIDPFPSLIIQDEMHLLDESLGTFGGLFETSLFEWFRAIGEILGPRAARYSAARDRVRLPHIIGATATASDVARHVQAIYQRNVVQFPHPGPGLHESFYVQLKKWADGGTAEAARNELRGTPSGDEAAAPWARAYASLMTNGRRHTVTTLAVLAAHAAASTRWLTDLRDPSTREAAAEEIAVHQSTARFAERRAAAVRTAAKAGLWDALLALVDLHRINLTYVTNKKGGDQILSAVADEVRESHRLMGSRYSLDHPSEGMRFATELISGGVDVGTIQGVVRLAESETVFPRERMRFDPSKHEPWRGLRIIVATSAVSHGVDVETFNAMTFAGLPSDIAEYIQASSRVGRTHVGFSLLVPTPQTRRDRYVVEVHEQFHRLLEWMIPPPAAERWAERAIERAIPSIIQTWLGGVYHQTQFAAATIKADVRVPDYTTVASAILERQALFDQCVAYIARSFGVGQPRSLGGAYNPPFYDRVIRLKLRAFLQGTQNSRSKLRELWEDGMVDGLHKPMTSLRDVDGQALVRPSRYEGRQELNMTALLKGLNAIRSGAAGRIPRGSELEGDESAIDRVPRPRRTQTPTTSTRTSTRRGAAGGRTAR